MWGYLDSFGPVSSPNGAMPTQSRPYFILGHPIWTNLGKMWCMSHLGQFDGNLGHMEPNGEAKEMRAEK